MLAEPKDHPDNLDISKIGDFDLIYEGARMCKAELKFQQRLLDTERGSQRYKNNKVEIRWRYHECL